MSNITNIEENTIKLRQIFENSLLEMYKGRSKKPEWSRERVNNVIRLIEEFDAALDAKPMRNSSHYYYAKAYEIIEEGGRKTLAIKRKHLEDKPVKVVPLEEYYDVLSEVHRVTMHGGRDKMLAAMRCSYFIPTPAVTTFIKSCSKCYIKKKAFRNRVLGCAEDTLNNSVTRTLTRGLVRLIDMQSMPYEKYEWILHYQDNFTQFSLLRPLQSNDASEVAVELLKIFLEIGCPSILVVKNGREFTADVIKELANLWSDCKILNGRPFEDSDKLDAETFKNLSCKLTEWMNVNSSGNWTIGLYFVQFMMNCEFNPLIQTTPYISLFACSPKVGLISKESVFLDEFSNEEDLVNKMKKKSCNNVENPPIKSSSSGVKKVKYADPFSNVYEESVVISKNENEVLPEHSVQIKTEYDNVMRDETMHDVTTIEEIKTEVIDTADERKAISESAVLIQSLSKHKPILCGVCGSETVPTHVCEFCHRVIHESCGIITIKSNGLLCPTCCGVLDESTETKREAAESSWGTLHLP